MKRAILIAALLAIVSIDAANAYSIEHTVIRHDPCYFTWNNRGAVAVARDSTGHWTFHPRIMLRGLFDPDCPGNAAYYDHYPTRLTLAWPFLKLGV